MNKLWAFFIFTFSSMTMVSFMMEGEQAFSATVLTAALPESSSTMTVSSTAGFLSADILYLDEEIITYTGLTATSFTGLTRGAQRSDDAPHSIGKLVYSESSGMLNSVVGYNVGQTLTTVNPLLAPFQLAKVLFKIVIKITTANYSFLEGDLVWIKILIWGPLTAGFIVSLVLMFATGFQSVFRRG